MSADRSQQSEAEPAVTPQDVETPPTVLDYELSADGTRILLEVECGAVSAVIEADRRLPDEAIEATFQELPDSIATVDEMLRRDER